MFNDLKKNLFQILIAQKKKKKKICIKYKKAYTFFYALLWQEGYIYGYYIDCNLFYNILIKFSKKEVYTYKTLGVISKIINCKKLISLSSLQKNSNYFLINNKGIFTIKNSIKNGFGGILIIKL
jgi:hypothetical protein